MTALTFADWRRRAADTRIESRAFIDGAFTTASDGATFTRICPIDGKPLAEIASCGESDVDLAVAVARAAFEDRRWLGKDPKERKAVLLRLAALMREHLEELALLETLDVGKPIADSLSVDVPLAADCFQYYAEAADKLFDEVAPTGPNDLALVRREPLGVIGAIIPWNYPLIITAWKLAPALVLGNSVVLKPAEQSSLSALRLAALAREAGLPDGVLNVVTGPGEVTGRALALHRDVDMIAFTGSTAVGKLMLRYAADSNMKRVALECGGKSPLIVMDDCPDMDAAAEAVAWGVFYNQGETCHACTRLLVHRSIKDAFIEKIAAFTRSSMPLGHPLDPDTRIGALIEDTHMRRVLGHIEAGRAEGARIVMGGDAASVVEGGFYVEPTIFADATNAMHIAQEEIFGPVLTVIPFDTEAEALSIANDTIYGLAASVWTSDMNRAHRMTSRLKAGSVWVNSYDANSLATPFGGFKQSGFGRDRSLHALDKYADHKTIWTRYR